MSLFAAQLFRANLLSAMQAQALHVNTGAVLNRSPPTQLAAVDLLVSHSCTRIIEVNEPLNTVFARVDTLWLWKLQIRL